MVEAQGTVDVQFTNTSKDLILLLLQEASGCSMNTEAFTCDLGTCFFFRVVICTHAASNLDETIWNCHAGRCLVGPGLGFVSGAKGVLTVSGNGCDYSYSAMIGDLTGTYMTRHVESCSFPPAELWAHQDPTKPEFYTQFITDNVK